MGGTSPARVEAGWFFFSQHRCRAVESDAASRDRHDVARFVRAAKHDSLDQIDSQSDQPFACESGGDQKVGIKKAKEKV